jgi:exodeoxyribonuclease VII small subunit
VAAGLSFNEARTALDLTLEALQAADLPIEEMAGLYQRANAFAERCQSLLEAVEQEVIQWKDSPQADG